MTIRFNWGTGVALVYVAFVAGTLGMVLLASSTNVDLVSNDYYARSLTVDQRLAATANGDRAVSTLDIEVSPGKSAQLVAHFRIAPASTSRGTLTWYRPSASSADRTVDLVGAALTRPVTLTGLARGRWHAQLEWESDGRDYYVEREVDIP